jgi:hypothetical protein
MLDRLISGAGAVADFADRLARVVLRSGRSAYQPVGLALAGLLAIVAIFGVLFGVENLGDRTLHDITAADVPAAAGGPRTYATVSGGLVGAYVQSFRDTNDDGQQGPDERSVAWIYFLIDPATKRGVTVESDRSPADVYTYVARGVVVDDAAYVAEDADLFKATIEEFGLTLGQRSYIDTTKTGQPAPVSLSEDLPAAGTAVEVSGSRSVDYVDVCSADPNGDGQCTDDEVDLYDLLVYDPATKKAVTVLTSESPEFAPASFTGILRSSPKRVADAQQTSGDKVDLSDFGVTVSPDYILSDGDRPTEPLPLFVVAIIAAALALIIVIGVAGGYVRFRPEGTLPLAASRLTTGQRIPLRVTGDLRTRAGFRHLREADADLVRFELVPVEPPPVESAEPQPGTSAEPGRLAEPSGLAAPTAESSEPTIPAGSAEPAISPAAGSTAPEPTPAVSTEQAPPRPAPTTLIIERRGRPEGVAVGHGELTEQATGTVMTFRGPRPALRLQAGTGRLLVSFDSVEERDRAASELGYEQRYGGL